MSPGRALRVVFAIVGLSVLITPWTRDLFVGDETKYAQVVREMRAGAWFLPTLDGTLFTHKPPLHFWLVDSMTYLFGVYSTWSFVLPSLAGFVAMLWLMWRMEGPIAAFVCGTSLMVWGSAQTARMDVTFTATVVITAWMLQRFLDDGDRRALLLAGAWTGIGTLLKGPMAPVIAAFLFIFEWIRRKRVPRGNYALATAIAVVMPLLWFVPAMILGGDAYRTDVLVRQTAGRAIGAWVHRSPFWFYIAHAPADLFPWFLLLIVAVVAAYKRGDARSKFYVSWILAVLVPYSALSSKLDVYMMAMIPPAALLIARLLRDEDVWAWRGRLANLAMMVVLLLLGAIGPLLKVRRIEVATVLAIPAVKLFFVTLAVAALGGIIVTLATRSAVASTISLGFVPLVALIYGALFLMPLANELASDGPIVRAVVAERVPPEQIAVYTAPYLWTRDMPRELERVRYVSPDELQKSPATIVVTSRSHSGEIAGVLGAYRKVGEFRMIGKWFDVYRR